MTDAAEKIVDVLLETGEPTQDYDHGPWDAIVRELEYNGIHGATHKEFDVYQGVYFHVPGIGRFWPSGDANFWGEKEFAFNFVSPEVPVAEGEDVPTFEVTGVKAEGDEWLANVDDLAEYCKRILAVKLQRQTACDAVDAVMAQSTPKKAVKGKAKADLGGVMTGAPGMMAMPSDI